MKKHQTDLQDSYDSESDRYEPETAKVKGSVSKPGRKPTDERWTRVVKFKPDSDIDTPLFSYIKDSNDFFVDSESEIDDLFEEPSIFIDYDEKKMEKSELDIEKCKISENELIEYAN